MIRSFITQACRLLSVAIALCLALMVVLVFGNVVLRYGFNSGITISEELSRWLFVWMTFLGAVVALKDRDHLGTDMLIGRLGPAGKKACLLLTYLLMLAVCVLLFKGAWDQARINLTSTSAVMEVSLSWIYYPGLVFAVLGALILLVDLFDLVTGRVHEGQLAMIQESEESPHTPAGESR
jgi:TRAP-type transport system small permease protein